MLTLGLAWGEWLGWPMLAAPLERELSSSLGRSLQLRGAPDTAAASAAESDFSLRFFGGVHLTTRSLRLAGPAWAEGTPTLQAEGVDLRLRYVDLWRAWRGGPLRVHSLLALRVDADLQRLKDGRASWQLAAAPHAAQAPASAPAAAAVAPLPSFGEFKVNDGRLRVRDAVLDLDALAQWALTNPNAQGASSTTSTPGAPAPAPVAGADAAYRLIGHAKGRYRGQPLKVELQADLASPAVAATAAPLGLSLHAEIGRAQLDFTGALADLGQLSGAPGTAKAAGTSVAATASSLEGLSGRFKLQGPSLAAVGDPLGVTLPTTHPFTTRGGLRKQGATWFVVVDEAQVGSSRLRGAFSYDQSGDTPKLSGRLTGPRLLWADLGPAVGVPIRDTVPSPAAASPAPRPGKVLPDRPFDLAALRVMDANVLIAIDEADFSTPYLAPLRPLRGHLQLTAGVLNITDLDARAGPGRLHGSLQLDGRTAQALLRTDLRWEGLRLEQWIRQPRDDGKPPFISGALQGWARLQGQGRSTAEILAHLGGQARAELREGRVSHLVVEAAGLDVAQALGVLIKGDDALPVACAVADLVAERGVFVPRVMVLDSSDSTLWVDGSVSLASEALDLRVTVSPKDFSPLALRTPLRLRGNLGAPQVSLAGGSLATRLGAAFLLALANPLAALLPLLDPGDSTAAARDTAGCAKLAQRAAARTKAPAAPAR